MNMTLNRIAIIVGILIVLILAIWAFINLRPFLGGVFGGPSGEVTINGRTFKVEVADTPEKREIGLSKKTSLANDQGMVFVFDKPDYYSFWMKEMQIPIDIIYINNNKVVSVYGEVKPPTEENSPLPLYKPTVPADRVLEINAGLSNEYNIKPGDTAQIKI